MKNNKKNNLALTAGIAAGVLAAGAAGYFLFGPNGKTNRKKVHQWMMEAKAEIVEKAKKIKAVTKGEFTEAIEAVTGAYLKTEKMTAKEAKELKKELLSNWDTLSCMFTGEEEPKKAPAKKAAKKPATKKKAVAKKK